MFQMVILQQKIEIVNGIFLVFKDLMRISNGIFIGGDIMSFLSGHFSTHPLVVSKSSSSHPSRFQMFEKLLSHQAIRN